MIISGKADKMTRHDIYSLIYYRLNKLINVNDFMEKIHYLEKGNRNGLFLTFNKVNNTEIKITEYFDVCDNPVENFMVVVQIDMVEHKAQVISLKTEYTFEEAYDKHGIEKPKVKNSLNRCLSAFLLRLNELEL